ncbi:class I adenylate-forming enzyme family protein [Pollutimonas bauzanensis]|uniref:class I adenylate-forming enzyme family protein n=1 Tax=Pollutimonas bauzanensis TaxID=658167 RepID=UPI00333F9FC8
MNTTATLMHAYRERWTSVDFADFPAIMDHEQVLNYRELYEQVSRKAGQLREAGVQREQLVAVAMERSLDSVLTILGLMAAGACPCPLEPRLTAAEIEARRDTVGINLVLVDTINLTAMAGLKNIRVLNMAQIPAAEPFWSDDLRLQDPGLLLFTSGSTGRPKGVKISHGGLLNNALGVQHVTQLTRDDRLLHLMPLYHTNGLNNQLFTPLLAGAQVALAGRFKADQVPALMQKFEPTIITGVPTMYSRMLDHAFTQETLQKLRFARCGSAPITPELHKRIEQHLGCPLVVSYGLSEATCTSTINPPEARKIGAIGKALPYQKVYLRDADGHVITDPNKNGEICIEGDSLMLGYVGVEKDGQLSPQGPVLPTGDVAYFDEEGYFFITGRLKDVIIRGGENISPGIIENVINQDPAVKASCVLGKPHHDLGEVPVGFVVPTSGAQLDPQTIQQRVSQMLSRTYWLDEVYVVDALPENSVGKVDKKKLREMFAQVA